MLSEIGNRGRSTVLLKVWAHFLWCDRYLLNKKRSHGEELVLAHNDDGMDFVGLCGRRQRMGKANRVWHNTEKPQALVSYCLEENYKISTAQTQASKCIGGRLFAGIKIAFYFSIILPFHPSESSSHLNEGPSLSQEGKDNG